MDNDELNVTDQIRSLTEQLGKDGRESNEIEKIRRQAELEKQDLRSALETAKTAQEQGDEKSARVQQELIALRHETDRRLAEKDKESESTR